MVDQSLKNYVQQNIGKLGAEGVRKKLIESGWSSQQVDQAIREASPPGGSGAGPSPQRGGKKLPLNYIIIGAVAVVAVIAVVLFFPLELPEPAEPYCGDGICGADEDEASCPSDCAVPVEPISISVSPASASASSGGTVTLDIVASDSKNLFGFQFDLEYDSSVLEFVSISEGTFLNKNGADTTFCVTPNTGTVGAVRNYACTRLNQGGVVTGVEGSGTLATVTFNALSAGTSQIKLMKVKLADTKAAQIQSDTTDGQVTVSG